METLLFIIGIIGNVISLLVFASPIKTFWRIVKHESTEGFEPVPYVVTLLGSSLWVYYGVTKPDGFLVATVNGVGIVMETVYVALFLVYAPPALRAKIGLFVVTLDVVFLGSVVLVTRLLIDESMRVTIIGLVCAGLNIFMYGSPLVAMKTVIATRSVEYMPFLLSFFLFLNGGVWTFYAILDRDVFLGVPNGIGFMLGAIQLILYAIYMDSTTKLSKNLSVPKKEVDEEGLQQRLMDDEDNEEEEEEEGGHLPY